MAAGPRKPKSQFEISSGSTDALNRAHQIRRDLDEVKDYKLSLQDIDSTIMYYLDNIVLPSIPDNDMSIKIPIIYGSPERWKSAQEDGYYKDKNGKIQVPLLMYRRTSMSKNRELGSKVDPNHPRISKTVRKKWSNNKNRYVPFSTLSNYSPVYEYYNVVIPDYVNITYDFLIWTDSVEQMNYIIESINYSEGAYWGEPEKFKFKTRIDDYANQTDLVDMEDRMIRTTFSLTLYGYIIPATLNKQLAQDNSKAFTNYTVKFGQEVEGNIEDVGYTAKNTGSIDAR